MIDYLSFSPLPGFSSPHVQTILGTFIRSGKAPPSTQLHVSLDDGDVLCCELSTPPSWTNTQKTIMMIHGLGGSHNSSYMIRLSRKFYQIGYRVLRINLRGCGSGKHLARLPYHGGVSHDVRRVIQEIKKQTPLSPLILIGFSLGGNIALKLAGESKPHQESMADHTIAVCPPIDLTRTLQMISHSSNRLYHHYYLKQLRPVAKQWTPDKLMTSMYEFDNHVTAQAWGFKDANDYYQQASSCFHLPDMQSSCQILFAMDDPFIDYKSVLERPLSPSIKVSLSKYGGHMGFVGWSGHKHSYFWLDHILHKWIAQVNFAKSETTL